MKPPSLIVREPLPAAAASSSSSSSSGFVVMVPTSKWSSPCVASDPRAAPALPPNIDQNEMDELLAQVMDPNFDMSGLDELVQRVLAQGEALMKSCGDLSELRRPDDAGP